MHGPFRPFMAHCHRHQEHSDTGNPLLISIHHTPIAPSMGSSRDASDEDTSPQYLPLHLHASMSVGCCLKVAAFIREIRKLRGHSKGMFTVHSCTTEPPYLLTQRIKNNHFTLST